VNYHGYVTLEYEADAEPRQAIPPYLQQLRQLIDAPAPAVSRGV
jgi:hypothetical protein